MVRIETSKPIAYDSPDHIEPWGTAQNNTKNPRFNKKLFNYIPAEDVRLLDIGCAGGGLVKSILDDGAFAVGIEGSDYSKKQRRAEWATVPDHLFTADATVQFSLLDDRDEPLLFNVITAWEFFEHISEQSLPGVIDNIKRHLAPHGIVLASIALYEDVVNGVRLHQTVQNKSWWVEMFSAHGLVRQETLETYFNFDMVRGEPFRYEPSVTIALTRAGESIPYPAKLERLIETNRPYEVARFLNWLCRGSSMKYVAWAAKRYVESFLPRGRPFPRHPFSH
jgi:2-polyprenyl-3-methyl-5-hydroxy-6-metoxy-1,4-benzoquinol methylase